MMSLVCEKRNMKRVRFKSLENPWKSSLKPPPSVLPEVVLLFFPRILDRTCTTLSLHPPASKSFDLCHQMTHAPNAHIDPPPPGSAQSTKSFPPFDISNFACTLHNCFQHAYMFFMICLKKLLKKPAVLKLAFNQTALSSPAPVGVQLLGGQGLAAVKSWLWLWERSMEGAQNTDW